MTIEQPVECARIAGQVFIVEGRRDGCILADEDAGCRREERAQEKNEKIEMRHARQNHVGLELPYQAKQAQGSIANIDSPEGMDGDPRRERNPPALERVIKPRCNSYFSRDSPRARSAVTCSAPPPPRWGISKRILTGFAL